MPDQSNDQPTRNSFASVIANASNNLRGLSDISGSDNSNTASAPVTLPSNSSSPKRQSSSSATSSFSQVINSANHRFVGASLSSHSAPNSINPSHMRTIESLIVEITALCEQLSTANQASPVTQAPIPIHAPSVGENLI